MLEPAERIRLRVDALALLVRHEPLPVEGSGSDGGTRRDAVRVLSASVPGVKEPELIFRTRCAAGLLNWLALAPIGAELGNKSEKQLERLLVPIVAGAFRGK